MGFMACMKLVVFGGLNRWRARANIRNGKNLRHMATLVRTRNAVERQTWLKSSGFRTQFFFDEDENFLQVHKNVHE